MTSHNSVQKIGKQKEKHYDLLTQELNWKHFWLEVTEVAVAILIAQFIWEIGIPWLKSLIA